MKLNKEKVKELWSQTYNTHGKPDWTHIFTYYDENIIFQDSIQKIEGKEKFIEMCNRLTKRCKELNMEIVNISQDDNIIIFDWVMTMMFRWYPSTPMYGATKLTLNPMGLIAEQRDYYDMWGDIYNNIPIFGKIYRLFLKWRFG